MVLRMRYRAQQCAKMAKNAIRQPEVEICRKPLFSTRSRRFPIRSRITFTGVKRCNDTSYLDCDIHIDINVSCDRDSAGVV